MLPVPEILKAINQNSCGCTTSSLSGLTSVSSIPARQMLICHSSPSLFCSDFKQGNKAPLSERCCLQMTLPWQHTSKKLYYRVSSTGPSLYKVRPYHQPVGVGIPEFFHSPVPILWTGDAMHSIWNFCLQSMMSTSEPLLHKIRYNVRQCNLDYFQV